MQASCELYLCCPMALTAIKDTMSFCQSQLFTCKPSSTYCSPVGVKMVIGSRQLPQPVGCNDPCI